MNTYNFHINLHDLGFLGAVFTGLTFVLLLWFTKTANRTANRFLALALATVVFGMGCLLGTDIGFLTSSSLADWMPLQFLLVTGPLIYFYVRKIVRSGYKFNKKDLRHFSPLVLIQLILILITKENFHRLTPVLLFAAVSSVSVYLYYAHKIIPRFQQEPGNKVTDRHRHELWRLRRLLAKLGFLWLLWVPYAVVYYLAFPTLPYYPACLLLAAIMIWLAAVAFSWPEVRVFVPAPVIPKPSPPTELSKKGAWLKSAMKVNRFYQDAELSLGSLAEKLDIHTHELSRIINTALKKNFNDFVNEYRVKDVIQKMQDPAYDHITLLGIAFESGFNSKTSFNRVFRQMTGKNPTEYKNELEKLRPSYNLGRHPRFAPVVLHGEDPKKGSHRKLNRNFMFRNYLKIAWRNIVRYKAYSAVNIAGLAVGFAAFLLIFLVTGYEQSFDQFHVHKNQLYRVNRIGREKVNAGYRTGVPFAVPATLRSNFPQLANVGAIMPDGNVQVIIRDKGNGAAKKFKEDQGIFFAEPQFFDMFSFPLVAGDYRNSLKMPGNVLLTQGWADKYFGHWQTAIGKTFTMDGTPVKVCGILKDMPANTDFPIQAVLSYATLAKYGVNMSGWGSINEDNYCFIQLKEGDSLRQFGHQLDQFTDKFIKPVNPGYFLSIQPLNEIHYDARYGTFNGRVFSKDLILALSTIGIFLLVVACVNFINLSTAQAVNRAREVGVRKVMGSNRGQLILQFLGEAGLVSCFALLVALAVTLLAIPAINNLLDISLSASVLYRDNTIFLILSTLAAVIFLAGFYPAFLLSGFNAVRVLKSALSVGQGGISLRRGLVVFQFVTAQVLIIGTLVVASQMGYFQTADMGFNKEAVLTAQFPGDSIGFATQAVLRNELMKMPGVEKISFGTGAPVEGGWFTDLRTPDNTGKEPNMVTAVKVNDTGFFNLFHIRFIAGRPYFDSDTSREYVVNENIIRRLGYRDPQQAIGKMINVGGSSRPIAGVVKNFNISSLRDSLGAVVLTSGKRNYSVASIQLNLAQTKPVIASMQRLWDKYYPDFTFSYSFLDQDIASYYKQETQLSELYKLFAAIAIFISCLGLYGLVTFMAAQRKKEIGVRKVLGAPISAILILLSREFTLLIGVAFVIAAPVAWYFMHNWLQQYAYHVELGFGLFAITIIGSILIAWATVGYTALKAALANPARSLHSE